MTTRATAADRTNQEIASLFALYQHCGRVAEDAEACWALDSDHSSKLRIIRDEAMRSREYAARRLDILGFQV